MTHKRYYHIYIIDDTLPFTGFTPAETMRFEHVEESLTPNRPSLEHVLDWIDSQASAIREGADTMRKNPGTKTLYLTARLPIEPEPNDTPKHKYIGSEYKIPAIEGIETEELKKHVSMIYKST